MLIIRRILDKTLQEALCKDCGVEYNSRAFAYCAGEGKIEGSETIILSYIGILQFTMDDEGGYINALSTVKGISDDEALMIMTRAAMEYMDSIGIPYVSCPLSVRVP